MKIFDRYLLKILLRFFLVVALGLLLLFDLFEFLNQLSRVGTGSYHLKKALWYVLLTSPHKLYVLLPVLSLLAVLLAQGQLVDRNESLALEAVGFSRTRQTLVLALAVFTLGLGWCGLEETLFKKAETRAWQIRARALASQKFTPYGEGFWTKRGETYLKVEKVLDDGLMEGIEIFCFEGKELKSYLFAPMGKADKGKWLLWKVRENLFGPQEVREKFYPRLYWQAPIPAQELSKLALPLEFLDAKTLWHYRLIFKAGGQDVYRYTLALWERLTTPFLVLAMGLLALSFATSPLKRKKPVLTRLLGGLFGGLFFYLLREAITHAGRVYALSPPLVALGPVFLVLGLAFWRFKKASRA